MQIGNIVASLFLVYPKISSRSRQSWSRCSKRRHLLGNHTLRVITVTDHIQRSLTGHTTDDLMTGHESVSGDTMANIGSTKSIRCHRSMADIIRMPNSWWSHEWIMWNSWCLSNEMAFSAWIMWSTIMSEVRKPWTSNIQSGYGLTSHIVDVWTNDRPWMGDVKQLCFNTAKTTPHALGVLNWFLYNNDVLMTFIQCLIAKAVLVPMLQNCMLHKYGLYVLIHMASMCDDRKLHN